MIHGYVGTNILQIMRLGMPNNYCDGLRNSLLPPSLLIKGCINTNGLIHIEENKFSNIIGCPDVDTSILSISSNQEWSYNFGQYYSKMNLAFLDPYPFAIELNRRKELIDYLDSLIITKE